MQFSSLILPVGALLSLVAAQNQFSIPPSGLSFKAGVASDITWTPSTQGTVTLIVRQGDPKALGQGSIIAKSIPNSGKFTWTPDPSIVKGSDFAIEIVSDTDPKAVNFTPQFAVDSTNTKTVSASKITTYTNPPSSSASGSTTSAGSSSSGSMTTSATSGTVASATTATTRATGAAATVGAKAAGALVAAMGVMVAL